MSLQTPDNSKVTALLIFFFLMLGLIAGAYCGYTWAKKDITKECNNYIEEHYGTNTTEGGYIPGRGSWTIGSDQPLHNLT